MKNLNYLLLIALFLTAFASNTISQETDALAKTKQDDGAELFKAVKTKDKARALELIKKGADLNYYFDGDTTLTEAIRQRDTEMAKILLAAGANPNKIDANRGASALRMAVQMSNPELVELLINKYKADVNPESATGYSILHTAADFNASKEITAILLAAGSNPNVINESGQAPYEYAISMQKNDIAQLLAMVTNMEKVAALKKGVKSQPAPTAVVQNSEASNAEEEMEDIAANLVREYKKQGFKLFDQGFAKTQGRNSNTPGDVKKQYIFPGSFYQLVMISKDAIAVNALMNGTLMKVPCDDCQTSVSTYKTDSSSDTIDGYRIITLSMAVTDYHKNVIEYILKSNSPGSQAKWLFLTKNSLK